MKPEEMVALYEYNAWADRRALQAASALTREQFTKQLGSSFSSVRDTLSHIYGVEWLWLERFQGRSPSAIPDRLKFSVPFLRRQPDFDPDIRIRTGRQRRRHATEGRQRFEDVWSLPDSPGGVNAPAATVCASVTAVFGGCSEARSAQVAASADCARKTKIASFTT